MSPPLYVHGFGMACPLGLTADSACAAIRAGLDWRRELPYCDAANEPIRGSYLGELRAEGGKVLSRRARWLRLLVDAARDLATRMRPELWASTLVLVAAPRSGAPALDRELEEKLGAALGVSLSGKLRLIGDESCDGLLAIHHGRELLVRGACAHVVVCAADSLVNARSIRELSRAGRLLTNENSDGVTPGEAAACVWISLEAAGAIAQIRGIGFGGEPARLDNDVPLRGDGVVAAGHAALAEAGLGLHDMDARVSDATGESYSFKEQVLLVSRLLRARKSRLPLRVIAEALGDCGAAAGLCGLIEIAADWSRAELPKSKAIVTSGGLTRRRAAAIVECGEGKRG